ncbi:MAG: MBL fold metallo-hydrolase [Sulfolobales archaeon]
METIRVTWHGHACVSISGYGKILVIDPHDGASIGLKKPDIKADYVLVTHEHFDHNAVNIVSRSDTKIFRMKEGSFEAPPFKLLGVKTFHDKESGKRRGINIVYKITTPGNISILHAGDLGHVLTENNVKEIGDTDIAILPVGGTFTIDHVEALDTFEKLKAKVLIPIHYWVKGVNLPLSTIDSLLKEADKRKIKYVISDKNYLEIEDSKEKTSLDKMIIVLRYL